MDLKYVTQILQAKALTYRRLWDYYDGDHPLRYSTKRLEELFAQIDCKFVWNWCAVVVDSVLDRIDFNQFDVNGNEELADLLNYWLKRTQLDLDMEDVHRAALVTGEAFVAVWKDEETGKIEAYYNDPTLCHVAYDPERPREKLWAAKWWLTADGYRRLNVFYPDHIEYYISTEQDKGIGELKFEEFQPEAENPYGQIPIFHFRRDLRRAEAEFSKIIPIQDAINKLFSDLMIAAEFGSVRQRWVIGSFESADVKANPGQTWLLPGAASGEQPTQVGEFSAADLEKFTNTIERLAMAAAIITRTPKHYLFGQGGTPSGEALVAMEAPLNSKVKRHVSLFSNTWQRVGAFILQLEGFQVDPEDIIPIFDPIESILPLTRAEIRKINTECGIPLATTLRQEGWSEADIEAMKEEKRLERVENTSSLAQALLEQEREFNAGPNLPTE